MNSITRDQYYSIYGLLCMSKNYNAQLIHIEEALIKILEQSGIDPNKNEQALEFVLDAVYNDCEADQLLKMLHIEVK